MKSNNLVINFKDLGGPVYIGRARGEIVREKLKLDKYDSGDICVEVIIPDETYAINSSFFLGMFGNSIRKAGTREAFLAKYIFRCNDIFQDVIESCIARALQEKTTII